MWTGIVGVITTLSTLLLIYRLESYDQTVVFDLSILFTLGEDFTERGVFCSLSKKGR